MAELPPTNPDVSRQSKKAPPDAWFGRDKALHFVRAGIIQCAVYAQLRALGASPNGAQLGASVATSGASLAEEFRDAQRGGRFSWRDLTWDAAGGVTGGFVATKVDGK